MKVCSVCGTDLPLDHFYNSYSFRDGQNRVTGKRKRCKKCDGKKGDKPAQSHVDDKPITDPEVTRLMNGWSRSE